MQRFSIFLEEENLQESLKTPIEFYMTDDTKMPKEIYAAFELDGTNYGLSLIESEYSKVYMLDFYRIVNVKKRFWSFTKPNHIRTCLSTIIKFMEACVPFVLNRMDGIIIDIPGKTGSEKYASFIERVLKRSYIKKYRSVPVVKTTDKARNYLFLVKAGVQPTNLFKTATFHKNFQFDAGKPIITSDEMDQGKGYYKTLKQTVSLNPSKKFAFGSLKVELAADEETVDMLDKASEKYKLQKGGEIAPEKPKEMIVSINTLTTGKIFASGGMETHHHPVEIDLGNNQKILELSYPHLMAVIFKDAFSKVKQYGFDDSKFNVQDIKYVSSKGFSSLPDSVRKTLIDNGLFSSNGTINLDDEQNIQMLKDAFKSFMLMDQFEVDVFRSSMFDKVPQNQASSYDSGSKIKSGESAKLDLDKKPVSTVPGFDTANDSSPFSGDLGFIEVGENVMAKIDAVNAMPEVDEWIKTHYNKNKKKYFTALTNYTGSQAYDMNTALRSLIKDKKLSKNALKYSSGEETMLLLEYFKSAPRLSNGIWVYRNADTPDVEKYEVGDDYIDAAFLSTSVRSTMSLGAGNTRLKIYLPKGTRCFPIFNYSQHSNENEIVLPATSVLRITETYNVNNRRLFVCTMIGSAVESLLDGIENDLLLEQNNAIKKVVDKSNKTDYNPEDKWAAKTSTHEESSFIKNMIKIGKLKLKI
jgi:hypothetical protein